MGVALELDAERLAHRRAAAVAADQVGARELALSLGALDLHLDAVGVLRECRHPHREFDLGVRERLQPFDRHGGELVLLALHGEGVGRLVLEDAEIELGHDLHALAVPDAEQRLDIAARDHLIDHAEPGQHLQGRGVGGRGARHVVDPRVGLEHVDRKALASQRQRGDDADRAAAGNRGWAFARMSACVVYSGVWPSLLLSEVSGGMPQKGLWMLVRRQLLQFMAAVPLASLGRAMPVPRPIRPVR